MDDFVIQAGKALLYGSIDGFWGGSIATGLVGFVEFTSDVVDEGLAELGRGRPTTWC